MFYLASNLTNPPMNKLTMDQYRFIYSTLIPLSRYNDPVSNLQQGVFTPSSLCKSLLFSTTDPDPDERFVSWIKNGGTRGSYPIDINSKNYPTYTSTVPQSSKDKSITYYFYNMTAPPTTGVQVYPLPGSTNDWMGLVLEWLNGGVGATPNGKPGKWCYTVASDGLTKIIVNPDIAKGVDANSEWFKPTLKTSSGYEYKNGQADNFMSRFGIKPNSPIFTYWFNDNYSGDGFIVDASAFQHLLGGTGGTAGGWLGFLQGNSKLSQDQYENLIFTSVKFIQPGAVAPCTPPSAGTIALASGTAFSAGMVMLAFLGPFEWGLASAIVIGGAVVSAASAGYSASKSSCPS